MRQRKGGGYVKCRVHVHTDVKMALGCFWGWHGHLRGEAGHLPTEGRAPQARSSTPQRRAAAPFDRPLPLAQILPIALAGAVKFSRAVYPSDMNSPVAVQVERTIDTLPSAFGSRERGGIRPPSSASLAPGLPMAALLRQHSQEPAMLPCEAEEEYRRRSFFILCRRPPSASSGWDLWSPARPAASRRSRTAGPWVHRLDP
jgi:hypothetical protein